MWFQHLCHWKIKSKRIRHQLNFSIFAKSFSPYHYFYRYILFGYVYIPIFWCCLKLNNLSYQMYLCRARWRKIALLRKRRWYPSRRTMDWSQPQILLLRNLLLYSSPTSLSFATTTLNDGIPADTKLAALLEGKNPEQLAAWAPGDISVVGAKLNLGSLDFENFRKTAQLIVDVEVARGLNYSILFYWF